MTPNALSFLSREHPDITVLVPTSASYAQHRATRGQAGQERKPLGIAIPQSALQVGAIVRWARRHDVAISVRTGGNDFYGRNVVDDGLIIDTRSLNEIRVASDKQSATIGGGVITKDLIVQLEREGVVAPHGNTWILGYVGWATLGGYGPLTNLLGMGLEGIMGAQLVNAQGDVVDADEDMLEGIRGMGGNLGIITSLTLKVYPARQFLSGMLCFDATPANIHAITNAERTFSFPPAVTVHHFILQMQARTLAIMFTWADPDHASGKAFLQRFLDILPPPKINTVAPKSPIQHHEQVPLKVLPWGGQRSIYVKEMSPRILDIISDALETMPAEVNLGWGMTTRATQETSRNCFGAGDHILLTFADMVPEEHLLAEATAWNDDLYRKLRTSGDAAVLEGAYAPLTRPLDRTAEQLFGRKWERVKELKNKYDPDNVFAHGVPQIA